MVHKIRKAAAEAQKQQVVLWRFLEILKSRVSSVEDGEKFESDEMMSEVEDLQERASEIESHVHGESAVQYMVMTAEKCD